MAFRGGARAFFAIALGAGAAVGLVAACLPDLVPATVSAFDAGTVTAPTSLPAVCGDGLLELDAGEECDPGEAGSAGCASCKVLCPEGGLVDPVTRHCYFLAATATRQDEANGACKDQGAHLATFGSPEELARARAWSGWPPEAGVWVGLGLSGSSQAYLSVALDEPGWPVPPTTRCEGCWASVPDGGKTFGTIPLADGGRVRGACVVVAPDPQLPWFEFPCDSTLPLVRTLCEREPAGSSVRTCAGNVECLSVPATLGKKRYLYFPVPAPADQAKGDCELLGGHLWMPDSREEREQLARDMKPLAPPDLPLQLWIGASTDGKGLGTWDDGERIAVSARPPPWGDHEPAPLPGPGRAYLRFSPGDYDTQLAHASSGSEARTYVCELR